MSSLPKTIQEKIEVLSDEMPGDYEGARNYFTQLQTQLRKALCGRLQNAFDAELREQLKKINTATNKGKKDLVQSVSDELAKNDLAIAHPETGVPCHIRAVGSPDKNGRFVFEIRGSDRGRSLTSENFSEYLPLILVPDVERLEPFRKVNRE